jgi:hypothetical protein
MEDSWVPVLSQGGVVDGRGGPCVAGGAVLTIGLDSVCDEPDVECQYLDTLRGHGACEHTTEVQAVEAALSGRHGVRSRLDTGEPWLATVSEQWIEL